MINGELIVDNFAGGGGASTGIELAMGIRLDLHGSRRTVSISVKQKVESQRIKISEVLHG